MNPQEGKLTQCQPINVKGIRKWVCDRHCGNNRFRLVSSMNAETSEWKLDGLSIRFINQRGKSGRAWQTLS